MEDDLSIPLSILNAAGGNQAALAIQELAKTDPARAQQLQSRLELRQKVMSAFTPSSSEDARGDKSQSFRQGGTIADTVPQKLPGNMGEFLSDIGDSITNNLKATVETLDMQLRDPIRQADQFVADMIDPQAAAQAELDQQLNDTLGSTSPAPQRTAMQGNALTAGLSAEQAQLQQLQNQLAAQELAQIGQRQQAAQGLGDSQQGYNALLLNAARQQGSNIVDRETLNRLAETIQLQQVPQVNNTLNAAAVGAQTPQITGDPANINQTLQLTQALAPQIQVPSLKPAARTNINQQQRANTIDQNAEANMQRQQLKALELAMKQFQLQVARPILSERR